MRTNGFGEASHAPTPPASAVGLCSVDIELWALRDTMDLKGDEVWLRRGSAAPALSISTAFLFLVGAFFVKSNTRRRERAEFFFHRLFFIFLESISRIREKEHELGPIAVWRRDPCYGMTP